MRAPIFTSIRQRSCTCGSQAALMQAGAARRQHGGHDRVLGAGHARLVEEHLGAPRGPTGRRCRSSGRPSTSAPSASNARMCVSMRRRPMTSPPGGGRSTCPQRASSGPASRIDARMRLQSVAVERRLRDELGADLEVVLRRPLDARAQIGEQLDHHLDVADARDVRRRDGAVGQQRRGDDGQRRVLVPLGRDRPGEGTSALDDEVLGHCLPCLDRGHGRPCYQPLLPVPSPR